MSSGSVSAGTFGSSLSGVAHGVPFPLELAFHGTAEYNIDSIFKEGMRSTQHWFGCQAHVSYQYSMRYVANGYTLTPRSPVVWKVLLFVLLMVQPGVQSNGGGVVVMNSKAHELPLMELTLTKG